MLHEISHVRDPELFENAVATLKLLGADFNATNRGGRTALFRAFQFAPGGGGLGIRELVKAGTSPDLEDEDGVTPLLFACQNWRYGAGKSGVVALLGASSLETRLGAILPGGLGALDLVAEWEGAGGGGRTWEEWEVEAVADALATGAPVRPQNREAVLKVAQGGRM